MALPYLPSGTVSSLSSARGLAFVERAAVTNLEIECTWVLSLFNGRVLRGLFVERIELWSPHVSVISSEVPWASSNGSCGGERVRFMQLRNGEKSAELKGWEFWEIQVRYRCEKSNAPQPNGRP